MKRIFLIVLLLLSLYSIVLANDKDTTSFAAAFSKGHFSGHLRYFFMSTQNEKGLSDYDAHAVGGSLRFETANFYHFQLGLGVSSTFNIGSSDLSKTDPATGQSSRYELALFDINNPSDRKDMTRLEEAYLKYNYQNSYLKAGRQFLQTPFINPQDGRMNTTVAEGIWAEINEFKKLKLELGYIWSISPRSTTGWYNIGESIGIYSTGVNIDGTKALYKNNLNSKAIFTAGVNYSLTPYCSIQIWDLMAQHIFNVALLQPEYIIPIKNNNKVFAAFQLIREDAIEDGGNKNASETYLEKGAGAFTFGGRIGWKNKHFETTLNYNRITKEGRYLFPREWGSEPFFTYLTRERNEGAGDVNAMMVKLTYHILKSKLTTSFVAGYYQMPDVKNYALNKYGLPSYTQVNADIKYQFPQKLSGFDVRFLFVTKFEQGNTHNNKKYIFNKVNMQQYNLVLNYQF